MTEEKEMTLIEKVEDKFTKVNVYNMLKSIESMNAEDAGVAFLALTEAVKPQKGGGASANPMKVIDGVNCHYCRFKDDYVAEELMNMSGGKSKGTSILASKVAYRIGRAADDISAEAMKAFVAGNYEDGAKLNAQSDALRTTIDDKTTFTDEAMANSVYHPQYGKKVEEETNQNEDAADNADVI